MDVSTEEFMNAAFQQFYKLGWQHRNDMEEAWRNHDDLLAAQRKLAEVTAFGDKVIAERDKLSAEIETLRRDRDHWRESRRLAIEAGELMKAEIETLRAFVEKVRSQFPHYEWPGFYTRIKDALAALDAANPAPASEPAGGAK